MDAYYTSFFARIDELITNHQTKEAYALIQEELALPYVPSDAQDKLELLAKRLKPEPAPAHKVLEDWLDAKQYEAALYHLLGLNLHQYTDVIQELFDADLDDELIGELIDACIEAQVDATFKLDKDGLYYEFNPASLVRREQDPIYQETLSILASWFVQNPTYLRFCSRLLEQERYERLPLDFEGIEPRQLAAALAHLVAKSFGQDSDFLEHEAPFVPLRIERRGE